MENEKRHWYRMKDTSYIAIQRHIWREKLISGRSGTRVSVKNTIRIEAKRQESGSPIRAAGR